LGTVIASVGIGDSGQLAVLPADRDVDVGDGFARILIRYAAGDRAGFGQGAGGLRSSQGAFASRRRPARRLLRLFGSGGGIRGGGVRLIFPAAGAANDSRQEHYQPEEEHYPDVAPGFLRTLDLLPPAEDRRVLFYWHLMYPSHGWSARWTSSTTSLFRVIECNKALL